MMSENWREIRYESRYTTDKLYKNIIDSALPDENTSDKNIPEYMVDFYEESNLSEEWLNTLDNVKKFILDADINQYMENK